MAPSLVASGTLSWGLSLSQLGWSPYAAVMTSEGSGPSGSCHTAGLTLCTYDLNTKGVSMR